MLVAVLSARGKSDACSVPMDKDGRKTDYLSGKVYASGSMELHVSTIATIMVSNQLCCELQPLSIAFIQQTVRIIFIRKL